MRTSLFWSTDSSNALKHPLVFLFFLKSLFTTTEGRAAARGSVQTSLVLLRQFPLLSHLPSKPSPFTPNHVCKRKQVRVWSWSSRSGSVWLLQMTPFIYLARRMWNLIFANMASQAPTDFVIKVAMIIFWSLIFWEAVEHTVNTTLNDICSYRLR